MHPNTYLSADHARECTFPSLALGCRTEQLIPDLVNHMVDTVTEKSAEPIAGPSHTSATTSGAALDHYEPHGIATN